MKLSVAIRKRIKYYLDKKNMNVWALCKATGIPCSTISTFMSGKTELITFHLENFLQMKFLKMYIKKQTKTNSFNLLAFFIFKYNLFYIDIRKFLYSKRNSFVINFFYFYNRFIICKNCIFISII